MNKDVPALAYIEQQILGRAVASGSLRNHVGIVEAEYGLPLGTLGNGLFWQTRLLSLLYVLVLFPREYWRIDEEDPVYREIEKRWSIDCICVLTPDQKYENTVYWFIHRLRNALAHANIVFHGDEIEISDYWNRKLVYRARISNDEAMHFLEVVGSIMANYKNRSLH